MTPGAKKGNAELHMVESVLCKSLISQASALEKVAAIKEKCSGDTRGSFYEAFELLADSFDYIFIGGTRKCVETIFHHLSITTMNICHLKLLLKMVCYLALLWKVS